MPRKPTNVVQSFRLRFWREPHVSRGDIWHERQDPHDEAIAIADPDERSTPHGESARLHGADCHSSSRTTTCSAMSTRLASRRNLLCSILPPCARARGTSAVNWSKAVLL